MPSFSTVQLELSVGNMKHVQKAFGLVQMLLMHHAASALRLCASSIELNPVCEISPECEAKSKCHTDPERGIYPESS